MRAAPFAAVTSLSLVALVIPGLAWAEEEVDKKWSDQASFAYVVTGGNSETSTLGFKNTLVRSWDKSALTVKASGIRAESTKTSLFAFDDPGSPGSTVFDEDSVDETTAENYYLNGRFDREISDRFFWYGGVGWDRNRPAGVENRYVVAGGVGNIWSDTDDLKFKTDYALTYTDEEDVSDSDDSFSGVRASWDYVNKFGESASYSNVLIVDLNLDETSDWRADMINSVAVKLTAKLALKVSLQWLYDAEPALKVVNVFDLDPRVNPGALVLRTDTFELDDLDTIFTASLVVDF